MKKVEKWQFATKNDELIDLVLQGEKTATTSLYSEYKKENIPKIGDKSIIIYNSGKDACIIENTNVLITKFKNITSEIAFLEGEGDKSLNYYKKEHEELFKKINKNFDKNTKVVVEIFKVIKKLWKLFDILI